MEFIEKFLSEYWQYVTLVIGAGFVIFGFICNKIKLPKFLTRNPDAKYSFGLRIVYILLGIGTVLYSLFCIFLEVNSCLGAANGNGI